MTAEGLRALPFILLALAAATAASFVLTPLTIRYARRLGTIDEPNASRRVHRRPVPRSGGLAVAIAFVGVGFVALLLNNVATSVPDLFRFQPVQLVALFGGTALAAALGFLDDRYQLRARWQLLAQVLLAAIAVGAGIRIPYISNPFGGPGVSDAIAFAEPFAIAISVLWILGMINSINFIDGLDGLSSGIALIGALTLALISLTPQFNQPSVALLCALLVGALAGFLPWNFHPARVFIGTAGVFAVGYALGVLSIIGTAKVAIALLVLGVPIIDTFWIIVRRLAAGQSPFTPDRGHFHHKLLDLGLSHRGAVLVIYAICAGLAALSLVLSGRGQLYAFLGIVVGGGLVLYLMTRRTREALDAETYDEPPEEVQQERRLRALFMRRRRSPRRDEGEERRAGTGTPAP